MGVHGDFVRRTAGLVKKMGEIAAELEAEVGPFRLFALLSRSAHVPEVGSWCLVASAGWMDGDLAGATQHLWNFFKKRIGPDDLGHLAIILVELETEPSVSQIQRKLGWVIREEGLIVGDFAVEPHTIWMVYRCLPNGDEFPQGDGPEGEQFEPTRAYDLKNQLDDSVVPIEIQERIIGMARPSGWYGEGSGEITREACWASIDFVSRAKKEIEGLEFPRIGPSPTGAVALQWDFDDISFVVRISSGQPDSIHFQEEGPDFHQQEGVAPRGDVLAKLGTIARRHVLS